MKFLLAIAVELVAMFAGDSRLTIGVLAIVATAASVNVVGDWLYERLADRGRAR